MKNYTRYPSVKKIPPSNHSRPEFNIDQLWGAAAQAHIVNEGTYVKAAESTDDNKSNYDIMCYFLRNPDKIALDCIELGKEVRNYFKGFIFKKLSGDYLDPFLESAMKLASDDDICNKTSFAIPFRTIASLPSAAERYKAQFYKNDAIKCADGGWLGSEGQRLLIHFKVVKSVHSIKWGCYYVTGITTDDKVVFFATKNKKLVVENTMVSANVSIRNHYTDSTSGAKMTRIHNVRTGLYEA